MRFAPGDSQHLVRRLGGVWCRNERLEIETHMPLLERLPAWVVPNDVSVENEVAEFRDMPLEQKLRFSRSLCREAAIVIASRADASRIWAWVDPLPESTIAAFERLGIRGPGMPS